MNHELQKLLRAADDISIKLRFALSNHLEDSDKWENQISEWERELDELNEKIIAAWKAKYNPRISLTA